MPYIDPKLLKPHPVNAEIYQEREDPDFEESIRTYGIKEPLVITSENVIISGVRRWREALKRGLKEVPYRVEDPEDEVRAIIEYNRYRQKTPREIYNEKIRLDTITGGREKKLAQLKPFQNDPRFDKFDKTEKPIRTRKLAAETAGISEGKLYQIQYIYSRQDKDDAKPIIQKLDRGELSVYQAFEQIKKIENPQPSQPKSFKCRACLREYADPVQPLNVTLCPFCEIEFQMFVQEMRNAKRI